MYDNHSSIDGQFSSSLGALIDAINKFPQEWALTPCVGKKNLWPRWNHERLDRAQLIEAIRSQKNHEGKKTAWTGVSIVTGPLSNGIMAIDFDGLSALRKYLELSSNQLPPPTKRWTSGKTGHFQILMSVPPEKWEGLKPIKIELENNQKLELRWNECSTLPPSIHPTTKKPYFWEENETVIAECPDFILDLMRQTPAADLFQKQKPETPTSIDTDDKNLVEVLEQEILPRLDAEEFYGSYLKLKSSGKNLKGLCPFHDEKTASFTISPAEKVFKCFGCSAGGGPVQFLHQIKGGFGSPTGKDFYSVVMELADRVGVAMPNCQSRIQNPESSFQEPKPNNVLKHPATNVVRPTQFQVPPISELERGIETLLQSDLKKSQLQLKISELAQKFRIPSADVWKIYRQREEELEQEANKEDTRIGIEQLLASQAASVKLSEIFPESLATPIETVATRMNLKPECYALALISGVSRFLKNGSSTMLVEEWNRYRCRTHGYFGVMIAEASQMKTPVLNAMIADPLAAMRENNQKKFETQKKAYEVEFEQWKNSKDEDKGPAPDAPVEKFAYITKATWEGIAGMVGRDPSQGILWLSDELAGFFNSANQYRSGKGSDKEDLLEAWSGNGAVIARAAGTTVNVGALSLSIYGNIQPKVLAPFLGDGSDDNGTFARFDFVQQPPALTQITLGLSKIDINPMLQALYERVDAISVTEFALDEEAQKLFVDYYNHCQRLRFNHPKQGMRAMLGKAAEKVGRVATILHCIHAAHLGGEVSPQIPASRVRAAIKWVEYTTQQALSINLEISEPAALAPSLAKIISLAERKGGTVSARDVGKAFDSKHRPNGQKIREWFKELVELKYGETTSKGQNITFTLSPHSPVSPLASNQDTERLQDIPTNKLSYPHLSPVSEKSGDKWGYTGDNPIPTFKPLPDKVLEPSGDSGDTKTPSAENSETLMMSCTTEISPEDAQKLRDIALLWWPEYYPEQIKGLITQMYGWQAPGNKYDVAVIAKWLEGQDELIRDRITELMHRRGE